MKLIQRIIIGFGVTVAVTCLAAIVLFNWSVTGWKALTVPTGSMKPNINPGSLVLVHSVPNASLKVGDVITYANPLKKGSSITHRITKAYKLEGKIPAFVTKGDANPSEDRQIVGGQVQGKVMYTIPFVGTALAWTHTLIGILLIIYLPALFIMFEEVKRLISYYKQFMPYKTALILAREKAEEKPFSKFGAAAVISALLMVGSVFVSFPVYALLSSNTVALSPNRLTVAQVTPPNNGGGNTNTNCTNNTNINISNTTNQTATTGNANNSGNTNGGSATSGNATNNNSSNTTVTIIGC